MGLFSTLGALAGNYFLPGAGSFIGSALGGALDGNGDSRPSGSATTTQQNKMDPRIEAMLFGADGKSGILSRYQSMLDTPQDPRLKNFGSTSLDYLNSNGGADLAAIRNASMGLMNPTSAPQATATGPAQTFGHGDVLWNKGESIQAPSQNNLDLSGAYNGLINGAPGANPYLTGAIQGGINQSQQAFDRMQSGATKNLLENVLPSIRGGAVIAGGYGGSRQGIAEGRALGDFGTQQQQAISDFGQHNTDAAVGARSGAYESDQNRRLQALQGLSAQQYATAGQDASMRQGANMQNQIIGNNAADFNARQGQQASTTNAQLQQGTNLADLQAKLATNNLNSNNTTAGIGGLSGVLGTAYGYGNNQDSYDLRRAQGVNGLLSPYLDANSTRSTTSPLYQNKSAGILGNALLASQLGFTGNGPSGVKIDAPPIQTLTAGDLGQSDLGLGGYLQNLNFFG